MSQPIGAPTDRTLPQLPSDPRADYAIYVTDLDGCVLSWNAGASRLKGYSPEEIVGLSFSRFFTPEDRADGMPQRAMATAAKEGRFEVEGWRIRKDGSRLWVLATLDAMRDGAGKVIGFVNTERALTERRPVQRQFIESETRYRRLIEAVLDYAIFQLDPDGNVVSWNAGAQRIKGYAPDEIIGQHFSRFYTDRDRELGVPQRALRTAAAEGRYEAEGLRRRKDGTEFYASVVIDPIRDENGTLLGYAKITRDITDRVHAEKALKEAQEQLAASQKMEAIGQLSGGIAHDFNNLLMVVQGSLETALRHSREAPNPNLQRAIANAMRASQRAAALTGRLLAFSRRQPLDPKPLDVDKFIAGAVEFLQRALGETIKVEAVGVAGLWPVEVDANHLETALLNLAINARDAMPSGGKLTIRAANVFLDADYARLNPDASPGQYVLISVGDTGSGMPPDVLSRAFEPFFTTKEVGRGTGLGLSQVYGFVKQSGGHIKLHSEEGQGTTVKIYLPRIIRQPEKETQAGSAATVFEERGETILVVEDDDDLLAYICDVLQEHRYRVLCEPNAQAALATIRRTSSVDLLLTDIVMPGLNGCELAKQARSLQPALKVIYMTGYSQTAVSYQAAVEEGVELLQKPISQAELAMCVRRVLDRSSAAQTMAPILR